MTLIGDGKVRATGPFIVDEGFELKRLSFMLSQKDVMVEGRAARGGGHWQGETDGQPHGGGVRVRGRRRDARARRVAAGGADFTWCEQVEVTVPETDGVPRLTSRPVSDLGDPG